MLQARSHALTLYSFNHPHAEFGYEEGVLPVAFHYPAPALVAGDIQDRSIYAVVAKQTGFIPCDPPGFEDQVPVPGASYGDRSRERSCIGMVQSVYTLVRELHGNAEPGLLHEPSLGFVEGLDMVGEWIYQVVVFPVCLTDTVQLLIDICDTLGPDLLLPAFDRQRIRKDRLPASFAADRSPSVSKL